jgi:deglycase
MSTTPARAARAARAARPTAAIVAADGVEQVEVTAPRDALAAAGWAVDVLSPDGAPVRGYHYLDPLEEIPVQGAIADMGPDELDAVVIPGGLGSPDTLRTDGAAVDLVRRCARAGTPIGVICHGPWVLVEAGVLSGRTLTCVPALRSDVTNAGASYVDEAVHVDRDGGALLVSGRNFEVADDFARALVAVLAG